MLCGWLNSIVRAAVRAASEAYRRFNHAVCELASTRAAGSGTKQAVSVDTVAGVERGAESSVSEQAGDEFSLGAAMLRAPPADGYASPHQVVPHAWLLRFAKHHADVLGGLFICCRGGRDLALQCARTGKLCLRVADREPDGDWLRQLAAVREALTLRGVAPTRLRIARPRVGKPHHVPPDLPPPTPQCLARLALVFQHLDGVSAGVTELALDVCSRGWDMGPCLSQLAGICRNVASLEIEIHEQGMPILPHPSQWPHLTSIKLSYREFGPDLKSTAVLPQIAPYMPQLKSLVLPGNVCSWDPLFPHTSPPHLPHTHLHLGGYLCSELCHKLLTHTPHLKHLSVRELGVWHKETAFVGKVWGLETLRVHNFWDHIDGDELYRDLKALPRARTGRTYLRMDYELYINVLGEQGIETNEARELSQWYLDLNDVAIDYKGNEAAVQPTALRNTLRQLASMQMSEDTTVYLRWWDWPAVVDVLVEHLPLLSHLDIHASLDVLTDEQLAAVVQTDPRRRWLGVSKLALQSDHSDVAWPWSELRIGKLDVAQLLRLPAPGHAARLRVDHVSFASCTTLNEASHERLHDLLLRTQCARTEEEFDKFDSRMRVHLNGTALHRQLSLIQAARMTEPDTINEITDAVLDLHTVTLLSQASLLTGVLLFHNCTWPLPANEYATLGYAAPSTVYRYELCGDGHTLEVAQHICEGAAQRRSEAGAAEKVWVFSDKATGTTQYGPYVELTGSSETAREGMRLRSTSDGAPFWRDDAVPAAPSPVAS